MKQSWLFSFPACVAILLLLTLYRVFVLHYSSFDLYPDEAQYWFWSLTPDWGYYSKPPMVAWLIAATTSFCGNTEFCIRLSSPFVHCFTALCIYGIAQSLVQNRLVSWCSSLVYITLPAVSLSSMLISTDVPFLFFWALAMFGFVKAVNPKKPLPVGEERELGWWILAGVAAGLGMLSKYTMVVFLPSVMLCLWLIPDYRKHFSSKGFYTAVILTTLIYIPNFLWNYDNQFVSYLHTKDNANIQQQLFHPLQMLEFIGSQFGVFGPILFGTLLIIFGLTFRKTERSRNITFLLCFTLPFLLLIITIALLSRAHANWAAPTYVAATVLVTSWLVTRKHYRLVAASLLLHIIVMFSAYHYDSVKTFAHIPEKKATDPFRTLRGWKKLAQAVNVIHNNHPETILLTNDRKIITSLLYYILPMPEMVKWNADGHIHDHFELTTTMNGKEGKDFLLIVKQGHHNAIPDYFKHQKHLITIQVKLYPDYAIPYDVYLLKSFKGY